LRPLDKYSRWVLEGIAAIVLWRIINPILDYLQLALTSQTLPTFPEVPLVPTLDVITILSLIIAAGLVLFGRYYSTRPTPQRIQELNRQLKEQHPGIFMFLDGPFDLKTMTKFDPMFFPDRGKYLWFADLLKQKAWLDSQMWGINGSRAQKASQEAILRLAVPIVKSRRQYRLSLSEKVSDLFGSFP
jgi:hypothetical protein